MKVHPSSSRHRFQNWLIGSTCGDPYSEADYDDVVRYVSALGPGIAKRLRCRPRWLRGWGGAVGYEKPPESSANGSALEGGDDDEKTDPFQGGAAVCRLNNTIA